MPSWASTHILDDIELLDVSKGELPRWAQWLRLVFHFLSFAGARAVTQQRGHNTYVGTSSALFNPLTMVDNVLCAAVVFIGETTTRSTS